MATLTDILVSVRELAFDRFPIPAFLIKAKAGKFVTNNGTGIKILPSAGSLTPDLNIPYATYPTFEDVASFLITSGYPIAYTGYFAGQMSPASSLIAYTDASLALNLPMLRRFYISDDEIKKIMAEDYYKRVLDIDLTVGDLETAIPLLNVQSGQHIALWTAIKVVQARRMSEAAADAFLNKFTDGTGFTQGTSVPGVDNVSVSIGQVFTITEDNSITAKYFQEDFNRVGSDNVLGDKNTFWFKLFLYLRDKLESDFKDYYFRNDNVINGKTILDKDLNYRAYFDSYPFTLSPYSRDILSQGHQQ